jgi:uncharacterized protein
MLFFFYAESNAENRQSDPAIPLIHSGKVLQEGIALRNDKEYEKSIQTFLTIPKSDTNWVWMRSELIISYLDNKEFDKAIALGEEAIKERSEYRARFYLALANAYYGNEQTDKAIPIYEAGLKLYPYDYLLHYNVGVALAKKETWDASISHLQQAISLNPHYANSHLFLGNIMITQGKKSRAMMSLGAYLALVPTNNAVLVLLNNLANNAVAYENSNPVEEKGASFNELDLLIKSNAALDKKFKSSVAFKAPVAQQMELMLESLPNDKNKDDFWMQFYVPFYEKINQGGLKTAFIYHILSSVDDKGVKRWLNSNKKELDKFYGLANQQLKEFRSQHTATVRGEKALYSFWYYDNHRHNAIGNQINDDHYIGPWVFYYPNGELKAEGNYTKEGKKTGKWSYYYADGSLKKVEEHDAEGLLKGIAIFYHQNGKIQNEITYKAGKIDGRVTIYYPCGQLKEELHFKDNQREGAGTTYTLGGQLNSRYTYKDNLLVGPFTYYHKNGNKKEVYTYREGKLQGEYQYYHKNGKISQQGQYKNEKMDGEWLGFYDNGAKRFKGTYAEGNKTGTWVLYNADESLMSEEVYDQKGNLHGISKYYTEEGRLYYEYIYKGDLLVGYKYFDKDGKVISEGSDSKGNFKIKAYHPGGSLRYEGEFKKGKGNGMFTYYHPTGHKSNIIHFKDNNYHGPYQSFYESGQKDVVTTYEGGEMNGYYRQYYKNGQVKTEGWMVEGNMEQTWNSYLPNGSLTHKQYFILGDLHGAYEQADNSGRPYLKSSYAYGSLTHTQQYDTLGAVLAEGLELGSGKNVNVFSNKKPRFEVQLQCGEYASDLKTYYQNGKLLASTPLKNGEFNGRYQAFYPNQKPKAEGLYADHEETGIWTWYFEDGKVDAKIPYKNGVADGERIDYYENGQIRIIGTIKGRNRIGSNLYYAPDGTLQIEKFYDANGLLSYRYLDQNKQLTPLITLANYTGAVKAYYPNGKPSVEQNYKNSIMEGKQTTYYPSGQIQEVRFVQDGQATGLREEYYPDGKLKLSSPYQDDKLHGQEVEYHANGKVKRKTAYLFGEKEGWETTYDANGKLVLKEYFRDGNSY